MEMSNEFIIQPLGDAALVVRLAKEESVQAHRKVIQLLDAIDQDPFTGFIEAVPTYTSVTVFYDPIKIMETASFTRSAYETVHKAMMKYVKTLDETKTMKQRIVKVPVLYGGKYGPDLSYVAKRNKMTEAEVIQIHTASKYLVYMIGFAPGFPFLGGMDERISVPRKEIPRQMIPAGSVGIAGTQTGVYTIETPGGWQIIGQTPRNLFLRNEEVPSLLASGDLLQFIPITEEQFNQYEREEGVERWQLK